MSVRECTLGERLVIRLRDQGVSGESWNLLADMFDADDTASNEEYWLLCVSVFGKVDCECGMTYVKGFPCPDCESVRYYPEAT